MEQKNEPKETKIIEKKEIEIVSCGLVMPISSIDGCPSEHWGEVKNIITESLESILSPKFRIKLVSDADDIGIIQKRIVQNVYESEILVCDVSGKNPNVMFELGMRLAFDKPVVIVKDDKTDYSFDTGIIEHISYPRDLRFQRIVDFKKILAEKVLGTYKSTKTNPNASPYLKNFGRFKVANLEETTVSPDRLLLEMIEELRQDFRRLQRSIDITDSSSHRRMPASALRNRAIQAIFEYIDKEGIKDRNALIDNVEFLNRMEMMLDAPRYFNSSDEFRGTINSILRSEELTNIYNIP